MDDYFGIFIFLIVAAVAVAAGIFGHLREKKRREVFRQIAEKHGLKYTVRDNAFAQRYEFLDQLRRGSNRYAFNILEGAFEGHPIAAFDYHYETHSTDSKGRRRTHHHYFSYFILEQEWVFPELRIFPESFLARIGQAMGFDDIDFESVEFSKAFTVRSPDKKFAYDICHTRMMEYLLNHRSICIEIEGRCVALGFNKRLEPEAFPDCLRQLAEIRALFPGYLFQN